MNSKIEDGYIKIPIDLPKEKVYEIIDFIYGDKESKIQTDVYNIETCMGSITNYWDGKRFKDDLTETQAKEFDNIGYSGKLLNGTKISRLEYLNSLNIGQFTINQTKHDNGDFTEKYTITRSYVR